MRRRIMCGGHWQLAGHISNKSQHANRIIKKTYYVLLYFSNLMMEYSSVYFNKNQIYAMFNEGCQPTTSTQRIYHSGTRPLLPLPITHGTVHRHFVDLLL